MSTTRSSTINSNVVINGDLTLSGSLDSSEFETLTIVDKVLEIATNSTTDVDSDGAGFIIKGLPANGDKTFLWDNLTDQFQSNQLIGVPNGTESAPSISFAGDPDTGLRRVAEDTIGFSAGGSTALTVSNGMLSYSDHVTDLTYRGTMTTSSNDTYSACLIAFAVDGVYRVTGTITGDLGGSVLDGYYDVTVVNSGGALTENTLISNLAPEFHIQIHEDVSNDQFLAFTVDVTGNASVDLNIKLSVMPVSATPTLADITVTYPDNTVFEAVV